MKRLLVVLTFAGMAAWLAGCNTMEGFGQDIQKGGQKIEEEAKENK